VSVTSLSTGDVPVETTRVALVGQASYESQFSVDPDGIRFTEEGVITFYGEAGDHTLSFSTLGYGYLAKANGPGHEPDPRRRDVERRFGHRVLRGRDRRGKFELPGEPRH
jgi:hypothetical protein